MKIGGNLQRIEFFLLFSLLLIIASIVVTVLHLRQKRAATDLVIHTYDVIQIGNDVYSQLLEIENDRIRYFVKGDSSVKAPILAASQKLKSDIDQLKRIVRMPQAVALLNNRIIPLINARWSLADNNLLTQLPDNADQFPYLNDQKLMNEIQESFQKLDAIESAVLVERQADLDRIYDVSSFFLLISFGLIGITSIVAWGNLRARQREINHLVNSLQEWNQSLEQKVDLRTREITAINNELRTINEEKDNFIGVVSHDLKSPITGIQNLAQLMLRQTPSGQQEEYLKLILESCQHMQILIAEILDVNRIDQGLQTLTLKKISANQLIAQLHKYYEVLVRDKAIELNSFTPTNDLAFYTDESIIYQILSNLLSNAIKFSKPGSRVELHVRQEASQVVFQVKDFGPGIEPQEIPLLFKKFQKLKARPTQGESSTGLGLFIVARLVQLLGARIEVDSVPQQQTSFLVYLPA